MKFLAGIFAAFLLATPALAGPLDGEWSGTSARGWAAAVTVASGSVSDFTWHGKTFANVITKASEGGAMLTFTFPKGSAVLKHTAAGADLTIREGGITLVHMIAQ